MPCKREFDEPDWLHPLFLPPAPPSRRARRGNGFSPPNARARVWRPSRRQPSHGRINTRPRRCPRRLASVAPRQPIARPPHRLPHAPPQSGLFHLGDSVPHFRNRRECRCLQLDRRNPLPPLPAGCLPGKASRHHRNPSRRGGAGPNNFSPPPPLFPSTPPPPPPSPPPPSPPPQFPHNQQPTSPP